MIPSSFSIVAIGRSAATGGGGRCRWNGTRDYGETLMASRALLDGVVGAFSSCQAPKLVRAETHMGASSSATDSSSSLANTT
eukprot:scaffold3378_cov82-Skeletonema_dohrnii-CCMP3373.AAC.2